MTKPALLLGLLALAGTRADAQATKVYEDEAALFKESKELFQQQRYGLAYPKLLQLYQLQHGQQQRLPGQTPQNDAVEIDYYTLACGLMLNEEMAAQQANEMIALSASKPHVQMLSYHLAEYYFRTRQYDKAADLYGKLTSDNLSNAELARYKFHYAYVLFQNKQFAQAKPLFDAIRQIPTDENYIDANYYYGFISFYDRRYADALRSFLVVDGSETYNNIVPYYITQIYYFNGDKEKALTYAEDKLSKGGQYYDLQMRQLVGHLYFEKKEFAKALPYLEEYVSKTAKVRREDLYELSYSYYATGNTDKAITGLKELGGRQDSLAQNAMFILGNAYLKQGNKTNARSAFLFCKENSSNLVQKETATFNYAKLSYDAGLDAIAISELKQFLKDFPKSDYTGEARELLTEMLARTNNFGEGLSFYATLSNPSEKARRIYPKLLYGRMVELINDRQHTDAAALLDRLEKAAYNDAWLPLAHFWKAELAYRSGDFAAAEQALAAYQRQPVTNAEVNATNAAYLRGYLAMERQNFPEAGRQFQSVAPAQLSAGATAVQQDAWVRLSDSWFMQKQYAKAAQGYEAVYNQFLPQADYALYQRAIISGAGNRTAEKLNTLGLLRRRYPQSAYANEAALETANTYIADEKYNEALRTLGELVTSPAYNKSLEPQVLLKQGISHFNMNNNAEAVKPLRTLLISYPNSNEAEDAVDYLRSAYLEMQQPEVFAQVMRQANRQVSVAQQDSLTWVVVNNLYQAKNYDAALPRLADYRRNFPQGNYLIEANYFTAFIYNSRKDYKAALPYYDSVAALAPNRFAEQSLLQGARINYFELQDYPASIGQYERLAEVATTPETRTEALRGLLRAQYRLNLLAETVPTARALVEQKVLAADDKMMAYTVLAREFQQEKNYDSAGIFYARVIALGKSEYGAEACYRQAEMLFEQNRLEAAEKQAFNAVEKMGSYDFWITRSYILLGNVYAAQKDYFNAAATFKSVSENALDPALKAEAQKRLAEVETIQNQQSKLTNP